MSCVPCAIRCVLALVWGAAAFRSEVELNLTAAEDSIQDRAMCERAWQLDRVFPPQKSEISEGYAAYAVRTFAGMTLDELKFVAIRSVRLMAADARVNGGLQNNTFHFQVSGKASCAKIGEQGSCALLHLTVVDLDLHSGAPGKRAIDRFVITFRRD